MKDGVWSFISLPKAQLPCGGFASLPQGLEAPEAIAGAGSGAGPCGRSPGSEPGTETGCWAGDRGKSSRAHIRLVKRGSQSR